jgi:hypothetical protein
VTQFVMSGGEKSAYRNVLVANSAPRIAMNLTAFSIPKKRLIVLPELFGGADVYVYTSENDHDSERLDEFLREHHESIHTVIGVESYDGSWLGSKYVPIWYDQDDLERLAHLCERYGRVAIPDKAINRKTIQRIKALQHRWKARVIGLTSKIDSINAVEWDEVIVTSWTSVVRYGETQVWDGHALRRYPAQQKDAARRKHRSDIARLGIDTELIDEDDANEVSKLALLSWQAWEQYGAYDPKETDPSEYETESEGDLVPITQPPVTSANESITIGINQAIRRNEDERRLLPIMGVSQVDKHGAYDPEDPDSEEFAGVSTTPVVTYSGRNIRVCNNCYLAPKCPLFKIDAECAFDLPVDIANQEQLQAAMNAILEMQMSRILFARFGEETEGQGMDPMLSAEMERFFKMAKNMKEVSDTRDLLRVSVEARGGGGGGGVLSRLFGAPPRPEVTPMTTKQLDQAIIDAEVLDSSPD